MKNFHSLKILIISLIMISCTPKEDINANRIAYFENLPNFDISRFNANYEGIIAEKEGEFIKFTCPVNTSIVEKSNSNQAVRLRVLEPIAPLAPDTAVDIGVASDSDGVDADQVEAIDSGIIVDQGEVNIVPAGEDEGIEASNQVNEIVISCIHNHDLSEIRYTIRY